MQTAGSNQRFRYACVSEVALRRLVKDELRLAEGSLEAGSHGLSAGSAENHGHGNAPPTLPPSSPLQKGAAPGAGRKPRGPRRRAARSRSPSLRRGAGPADPDVDPDASADPDVDPDVDPPSDPPSPGRQVSRRDARAAGGARGLQVSREGARASRLWTRRSCCRLRGPTPDGGAPRVLAPGARGTAAALPRETGGALMEPAARPGEDGGTAGETRGAARRKTRAGSETGPPSPRRGPLEPPEPHRRTPPQPEQREWWEGRACFLCRMPKGVLVFVWLGFCFFSSSALSSAGRGVEGLSLSRRQTSSTSSF